MFTSLLYKRSPIFIQNTLLSVRALARKVIREGKSQGKLLAEIEKNEFDASALAKFSNKQLDEVISLAKQNVPFYQSVSSAQLDQFPYISKQDVREQKDAFIAKGHKGSVVSGATSGTTGTPLVIKQDIDSVIREQAFVSRHLKWAGYQRGDKRAWIRGDMVVPLEQKTGPFWRYSYFEQMILLSSFHMTQEAMAGYIEAMTQFGVDVIQAYPSSIVTLAKYLESKNEFYPDKLKAVITSSESLSEEDREIIEQRFKCRVFDWYGLFERVAAIANCEHGRYHLLTDYSQVEFLESDEGRHEIVGTNFNNRYFPLIRYKTGDHVVLSDESSCPCGRVYPIVKSIEGRVGDYLLGEDGQKVHILNHIPKGVEGLLACQFVQDQSDVIEAVVVVDEAQFDVYQQQILEKNIKERLGSSMQVLISKVDALPRTKNGKVRQAVCSI